MFRYYLPQIIFFSVFFAASIPVLIYLRRKNPDPRFRPHAGEMALMTLIAIFLCGGMAVGLGILFKPENDGKSFNKRPDEGAGWSHGLGSPGGARGASPEKASPNEGGEPPKRRLTDRN